MLMRDALIVLKGSQHGAIVSRVRHGLIDRVAACLEGAEGTEGRWTHSDIDYSKSRLCCIQEMLNRSVGARAHKSEIDKWITSLLLSAQHILIRKRICGCCSLSYPEMLSSFITSDQTEWKCCSNLESFSQTLLSCHMLSKRFLLVRNKRKPTRGLLLIFLLSLWVTEFAFQF